MEKMIYQVVAKVNGQLKASYFSLEVLEQSFKVLGTYSNPRVRQELQGQPVLKDMMGPMYNGMEKGSHVIRYESKEAFEILSK